MKATSATSTIGPSKVAGGTGRRIGEGKRNSPYRYHKPVPDAENVSSALNSGVPEPKDRLVSDPSV
jgi:hypothetical protein